MISTGRRVLVFIVSLWIGLAAAGSPARAQESDVCIQCHSGQQGHLAEPVSLWQESIHFLNGITCHHCHGGDPTDFAMAMSPERGFIGVPSEEEIPGFCGRCHVGVLEDYQASAHGQALGAGGPTCVTCHGSHAVRRATADLINPEDCSRCHEYGRAEEIKTAVAETDSFINGLAQDLAAMHRTGIDTSELEGRLFSLRNTFHRLFHTVDVEQVREETSEIRSGLEEIEEQVSAHRDRLTRRKIWGGAVAGLLLVAGLLGAMLHKSYLRDDHLP